MGQHKRNKEMSNTEPTTKRVMNSDAHEGYVIPVSYKTPTELLLYTLKSGKNLSSDRGKKHLHKK